MTASIERLIAAYAATGQKVAADRRALIAAQLAASLDGNQAEAARRLGITRQAIGEQIARAVDVRADPNRLTAALALGGPIPNDAGVKENQ